MSAIHGTSDSRPKLPWIRMVIGLLLVVFSGNKTPIESVTFPGPQNVPLVTTAFPLECYNLSRPEFFVPPGSNFWGKCSSLSSFSPRHHFFTSSRRVRPYSTYLLSGIAKHCVRYNSFGGQWERLRAGSQHLNKEQQPPRSLHSIPHQASGGISATSGSSSSP